MAESSGGTRGNVHRDSTSYTPTGLGHELPGRSKYPNRGWVMGMEYMKIQASQSHGADMTRLRDKNPTYRQNNPQLLATICLRSPKVLLGIAQLSPNSEQS